MGVGRTDGPLGVGLVGCGVIGQIHADTLRFLVEDGDIVAVAAADPVESSRLAADRNCAFGYTTGDAQALIADPDVDAVLVATPTDTHGRLVRAALAMGKAVLCEKPLAPTYAEVAALVAEVGRAGTTAQVGFHQRFHPIVARLRQSVTSGEFGRAMGYTLREDQFWPTGDVVPGHSSWRSDRSHAGGGALIEHSIHATDILCHLFGVPTRVYATTRAVFGYDVEDVAAVTLEHPSGVVGTLLSVFNGVRGREERRFEVFFEHASVETTSDFIVGAPEDGYRVARPGDEPSQLDLDELRGSYFESQGITRRDFLFYTYLADRAWARAAATGEPASPGFGDALAAHAVVEAAYRSASRRAPVEVAEVTGEPAP